MADDLEANFDDFDPAEFGDIDEVTEETLSLSDTFKKADQLFLETEKTDLDYLAYKFILQFFENTEPLSPYGFWLTLQIQPSVKYNDRYVNGKLLPELGDQFPPSTIKARKELDDLQLDHERTRQRTWSLASERSDAKAFRLRRRKQIKDLSAKIEELKNSDNQIVLERLKTTCDQYQADLKEKESEIILLEIEKGDIDAKLKALEKKIKSVLESSTLRVYPINFMDHLLREDVDADSLIKQYLTDWQSIKDFLLKKIEEGQRKQSSPLHDNLGILSEKLGIPDDDRRILEHVILRKNVKFYDEFFLAVSIFAKNSIPMAKLCNVSPDKITELRIGSSVLIRKGLIGEVSTHELNPRILSILSIPGITGEAILTKMAGVPVREVEKPGFRWSDVEATQGTGAKEMYTQLRERRERKASKPLTALLYGEKGAAKTQGAIKAALDAGYENALMAYEFDEKGQPLTYAQRIASIRMALAIGENIPDFALIADEIDKMSGDTGSKDSLALLRLFENAKVTVIATANDDKFSEAFKDRFSFSVRFHVPIADRRIDTFFAMAAGKLDDLQKNNQDYEDLIRRTEVSLRTMEQAIDNASSTGRGIEAVKLSFRAKAELMTGSRTGLMTSTPIVESWRFNYFNGQLREPKNTSIENLFTHIEKLPPERRGVTIIAGNAAPKDVEIQAFPVEIAKRLGIDVLWTSARTDFKGKGGIEATLNQAQDMHLMTAVEDADEFVRSCSEEALKVFQRHTMPVVFLVNNSGNISRSSPLAARAHFIVDCYAPSLEQRMEMCKQFFEVELPKEVLQRMPDITLDVFLIAKYKRFQVLQDPNDLGQIEALLQREYNSAMSGADQRAVFVEWGEDTGKIRTSALFPLESKALSADKRDIWGPPVPF